MDIAETASKNSEALIELTADVVAAYVSNNPVPAGELPNLIADVHAALGASAGQPEQPPADKQKPAVNPKNPSMTTTSSALKTARSSSR